MEDAIEIAYQQQMSAGGGGLTIDECITRVFEQFGKFKEKITAEHCRLEDIISAVSDPEQVQGIIDDLFPEQGEGGMAL